ncbi:hypothetical protein KDA_75150 [Dictyobacter alpinus]|uniref:DNA primase/polymerase bifunctional N-terminal domain-containing protein n=1 Tax=Dictyobacter alpinus TaxID=2014873 RepID=A0A402BL13_9CHLR|nr:bifunctional DNA primase/polymerase [Dictyobacter alpinus]GCE32031.1 hypothetical protein KDA_75150 [Dictyobacter alpinus]
MVVAPRSMSQTPACQVALAALEAGLSVLPIKPDGSKQPAVSGWKNYQQFCPSVEEVETWFRHPHRGLAVVTGYVSGGLVALDFDDPKTFEAWRKLIRCNAGLQALYEFLAEGYEEKTPKGGRHILFRCPEAFQKERRPGNQKLALRPVPPPQRFETLVETREEGGLIIIDPSRGAVHPNGKPYVRLRGSVSTIRTISAVEREQLYASLKTLDEAPELVKVEPARVFQSRPGSWTPRVSVPGERPGDLFMADPINTWESLLVGWDISEPALNAAGYLERYLRHPGKAGPGPNCTLNADGTDRLFCFSPSVGLPMGRYFTKFEFFAYWFWGGDIAAAVRALVEQGYTTRKKG